MNIYILNYNNYYNRQLKLSPVLTEAIYMQESVNFNPKDGVMTSLVVGDSSNMYSGKGDYLVCAEDGEVVSNWFIIESDRNLYGQYTLTLRRDLLADNYENLQNSDVFIEKGTPMSGDVALFNNEDMSFNQILTSETLLKDKTNCPWLLVYTDLTAKKGTVTQNYSVDYLVNSLDDIEEANQLLEGYYSIKAGAYDKGYYNYWSNGKSSSASSQSGAYTIKGSYFMYPSDVTNAVKNYGEQRLLDLLSTYTGISEEVPSVYKYNGRVVQTQDGKIYRVKVNTSTKNSDNTGIIYSTNLSDALVEVAESINKLITSPANPNSNTFMYKTLEKVYTPEFIELTEIETSYEVLASRYHCNDAPYDILAIPYGTVTVYDNGTEIVTTKPEISINTVMSMIRNHGSYIYDAQLVPYCPVQELIQEDGSIDVKGDPQKYSLIKTGNTNTGIIFNTVYSTGTFDIDLSIDIEDVKISNECDKYRLVGGNYASIFEFSPAKNSGVDYFNIDFTYKPFNPYIHVNPNFKGLYGKDLNGPRGLIMNGDFSLSRITDQFVEYELQNKNYQSIFNRQIENMETNNSIQREKELWSMGIGALSTGLKAGIGGNFLGTGGITTGLLGAGVSIASGLKDLQLNDRAREEAIDYTKDQFGYQLGNIKALPDTLTKVSAFTANNKIFPILEYYTCTDTEKQALKDKLKYNGYTVMRIGKFKDWLREGYLKCKLIRLTDTDLDQHMISEIANELDKGVYI